MGPGGAALRPDGWWSPQESGLKTLFASRVLLESVVRELLGARSNVRLLARHDVTGLVTDGTPPRVTGVRLRARDATGVAALEAELVVDASGRGSHAPAWLEGLLLPAPEETVVDAFVGYSTRWYQAPEPWPGEWWWKGIWIDPEGPQDYRAAVADDYERVLDLFPRVRERLAQRAGTLSGGEQQMLAMARALMARPKLICMDEPTMGLSPLYVDKVLELIDTINRQGVTVFMVEQNASLALEIAHYGYVLQTGRVVLEGPAKTLLDDERVRDAYLGGEAVAA